MFDDIKNWVMNTLLPIIVWLVVIGCFVAGSEFKDISFVCKNSSTSCTLEKRNYLNIKTSKKVLLLVRLRQFMLKLIVQVRGDEDIQDLCLVILFG